MESQHLPVSPFSSRSTAEWKIPFKIVGILVRGLFKWIWREWGKADRIQREINARKEEVNSKIYKYRGYRGLY